MQFSRRKFIASGMLALTGLSLANAFWFEKTFVEINEFFIGQATKEKDNIKVLQVSDIHLQSVSDSLRKLCKKINQLKPDLIVFTGDAVDKANNLPLLDKLLSLINKDIRKTAILGNWEYWGKIDLEKLNRIYEKHNGVLLVNDTKQYVIKDKTLSITGVDDFLGGTADIRKALVNYRKSDCHIILNHCPQYNEQISDELNKSVAVDFILSGHTHGGQINLFGFIPFLPQGSGKYVKGWYNEISPKVYVSKGIGTSIFPARFGARAEIAMFHI
ncbi:MAG: metallophosphoesterase [Pedobacter sp.]|nr:MAG: metallophosphoesterase [Pedobacter sp.]